MRSKPSLNIPLLVLLFPFILFIYHQNIGANILMAYGDLADEIGFSGVDIGELDLDPYIEQLAEDPGFEYQETLRMRSNLQVISYLFFFLGLVTNLLNFAARSASRKCIAFGIAASLTMLALTALLGPHALIEDSITLMFAIGAGVSTLPAAIAYYRCSRHSDYRWEEAERKQGIHASSKKYYIIHATAALILYFFALYGRNSEELLFLGFFIISLGINLRGLLLGSRLKTPTYISLLVAGGLILLNFAGIWDDRISSSSYFYYEIGTLIAVPILGCLAIYLAWLSSLWVAPKIIT